MCVEGVESESRSFLGSMFADLLLLHRVQGPLPSLLAAYFRAHISYIDGDIYIYIS